MQTLERSASGQRFHRARRWESLSIPLLVLAFVAGLEQVSAQDAYDDYDPSRLERSGVGARRTAARKAPIIDRSMQDAVRELRNRHGYAVEIEILPGIDRTVIVRGLRWRGPTTSEAPSSTATDQPFTEHDASASRAASVARAFIESERALLGAPTREGGVVATSAHALPDLTVVRLEQIHESATVLGAGASVILDGEGRVSGAIASFAQGVRPRNRVRIDEARATAAAHARLASGRFLPQDPARRSRLAILRNAQADRFVYDLWLHVGGIPYRALVDAESGEVIGFASVLRSVDCSPVPRADLFTESPAHGGPSRVTLADLDCQETSLSGEFIRAFRWLHTDPFTWFPSFSFGLRGSVTQGGVVFGASGSRDLAQTTIYHHATEFHAWFRELGFDRLDRPFPAVANAEDCFGFFPCANAYYDPIYPYSTGAGILVFGTGFDVNFGLEADVICHEYTHAVVHETSGLGEDFFDPRLFYSLALNEAFADWFSCTFVGDPALGEYSGAAFDEIPLRNLDNDLRWPGDIDPEFFHDTGQIWGGALWDIRDAFSNGGVDPQGIRTAERLVYATLVSTPSNADFLIAAGALITASETLALTEAERITVRDILAERGLTFRSGEPPVTIEPLRFGEVGEGVIAAAVGGRPRLGSVQHEIVVGPEGARLEVEAAGDGNIDLYLRYNAPVALSGDSFVASFEAASAESTEIIEVARSSSPALAPGSWFVAIVNRSDSIAQYSVQATLEVDAVERIVDLASGVDVQGSIGGGPALSVEQYRLDVGAAAGRRLDVSLSDAGMSLDLYARRGAPVEVGPEGQVVADVAVRTSSSTEMLALDAQTIPALEPGAWFFAVRNVQSSAVDFTLRADLSTVNLPPESQSPIGSGQSVAGTADATTPGTARLAPNQYTIAVPADATRLRVFADSDDEVGIYLRRGARIKVENGRLAFDHASSVPGPGDETAVVDLLSSPILEPGTYYVAIANRGALPASFTVRAEITTDSAAVDLVNLPSGQWGTITVEGRGAGGGTSLSRTQYRMTLLGNETGLDVLTNPLVAGNIDLYVRKDRPVQVLDGAVVADWRGETASGAESITVFEDELSAGTYYLAFANRGVNVVQTDVLAVYDAGLPISVSVEPGDLFAGSISAAPNPPTGCRLTLDQFVVRVPANALRLEIHAVPTTQGPLSVLSRFGSRILIDLGFAIFDDEHSTSNGPLIIEGTDLRPGLFYFAIVNCQGREESYELSIEMPVSGSTEEEIENGMFASGAAEARLGGASGRLAITQYRFSLPAGLDEVTFGAWGGRCGENDIDLLIAHGSRVTWDSSGATNALWSSERVGPGAESVRISPSTNPPLRPGTYWAAIVNRSTESVPVRVGVSAWPGETVTVASGASARDVIGAVGGGGGVLLLTQFRIDVPPGATRLEGDLSAVGNPNLDIDLHARYGIPIVISRGALVTDQSSESFSGLESIDFPIGGDCLRPGPYYFAVANFSPSQVSFDLALAVTGDACLPIDLGDRVRSIAPAGRALGTQHCVTVGQEAQGLQFELIADDLEDVDLYIRRGSPVEVRAGSVIADLIAESESDREWYSVPAGSLQAGTYFIAALSNEAHDTGCEIIVRPLEGIERSLALGGIAEGVAPASSADEISWLSPEQFVVDVPPGTERFEIELESASGGEHLDIFARRSEPVEPDGVGVLADASATGDERSKRLSIAAPEPGRWHIALRNRRARSEPFLLRAATGGALRIIRGDADENGSVNLTDGIVVLHYLFLAAEGSCPVAADSDGTGSVNLSDPIYLLQHLFQGGPPPIDPYPACGEVAESAPECTGGGCL